MFSSRLLGTVACIQQRWMAKRQAAKESRMDPRTTPVVFTPDNEPYLGRHLLFHFDQLISSVMEQNVLYAPMSHGRALTDHQRMACQVIPQALSITLSIRELIRQRYLFWCTCPRTGACRTCSYPPLPSPCTQKTSIVGTAAGTTKTHQVWQRCSTRSSPSNTVTPPFAGAT